MVNGSSSIRIDMLQGPLLGKIIRFALPMAASSILQLLFNATDIAVVGHLVGPKALAAVGSNSSVISLLINLFVGVSVGANVVLANYIGGGNRQGIKRAVATAVASALASGVVLLLVGFFAARPILELIDTPADILDQASLYLRIYFLGMPFFIFFNFGASILRSMGDTQRPLYCLLVAGVINVGLNLFFVIVLHLEVAGVAIATVISNMVSALLIWRLLLRERNPFRLSFRRVGFFRIELVKMLRIGVPAGIQAMVFSFANVVIQSCINSFGAYAVAGSAAALNFENLSYLVILAFDAAATTFIGQNMGAGQLSRCRTVYFHTMWLSLVAVVVLNLLFVYQQQFFISIFTTSPLVAHFAYIRFHYVLLLQFMAISYEVSASAMRGMGHSALPAFLSIFGTCVLRLIWVYGYMPTHHSFATLLSIYPISWLFTGILICTAYYVVARKKGVYGSSAR